MDEFFKDWFGCFSKGLDELSEKDAERLFWHCGTACARNAVRNLYRDLFDACGGDMDMFFSKLDEVPEVGGAVIRPGMEYEIRFKHCSCPLHTEGRVNSVKLCECSAVSVRSVLKMLMPERVFTVQKPETILGGSEVCRFRIADDIHK